MPHVGWRGLKIAQLQTTYFMSHLLHSGLKLEQTQRAPDPLKRPLRLLLDAGNGADGVQLLLPLLRVPDVVLQQERVHLAVHILHCNLLPIESAALGSLDFCTVGATNSAGVLLCACCFLIFQQSGYFCSACMHVLRQANYAHKDTKSS